jgi:Na+/proline symporter
MAGLHPADVAVLLAYLVATLVLGVWVGRGAGSVAEFFMPRRFGKGMMVMNAFGTGTASDQAVTVASATFRNGLAGIWYQWLWLLPTPFYWVIAPIFRRLRCVTTADAYRLRFGPSVAWLFAVVGVVGMAVKIGLMLKGMEALVVSGTGAKEINGQLVILVTAGLFVAYGVAGGLAAAVVNDFVQGLLTLAFSVMLLPFVLGEVGGLSGMRASLPDAKFLDLTAPGKVTAFFVVMMSVQALVGIVAQPFIMGVCAAGKTESDGRFGFMVGNFVKRICTVCWCLTGLAAVAWYTQRGVDSATADGDQIYGELAQTFLPRAMPGLLGLFLAATLAGVMSSCGAFMLSAAALFTQNIYRPLAAGHPEGHYLTVGRVASVAVVVGGVWFAFAIPDVVKALEVWFMIAPMMGIAFWLGLVWRPMTAAGAWASTLTGFAVWFAGTRPEVIDWLGSTGLGLTTMERGEAIVSLPWLILGYLTAATAAGVLVSLVTPKVPEEQLDRFYNLTRTPVEPGEVVSAPCTLPPGVKVAARRMLVRKFGLEIPMPSVESWVGFLVGWVFVVALVASFVLIVRSL